MVSMRMVEMPVDEVIEMIPVRNGFVTAAGAMHMACVVPPASVVSRAASRVGFINVDPVLIDVVLVGMMQVAVVKVIHVITMLHSGVATIGPVLMAMLGVRFAGHDRDPVCCVNLRLSRVVFLRRGPSERPRRRTFVIRWLRGAHARAPVLEA